MDTRIAFVDLKAQYQSIQEDVRTGLEQVILRGDFILGSEVTALEKEFADYCEVAHAVAVDSGTTALELLLRAYAIGGGDEVITVTNTFIATAFAISYVGAQPVLVDCDPDYYTIDVDALEAAITPRTRAIIPVHLYGQPANMDAVMAIAMKHGLIVIEDACQAHGARYKGRRVGSLGHAAAFSFYPAKNLGGYGDGGMIVTDDPDIAHRVQMLRNYGQSKKYYHDVQGYNHRLDTLQAAVLRIKLRHLDDWNAMRQQHARLYGHLLANTPFVLPRMAPECEPVWHLYVIRAELRDELAAYLAEHGISTGIHYPIPIHLQKCYRNLHYAVGSFPIAEHYASEILSLPMFPELTDEAIRTVCRQMTVFSMEHAGPVPM